MQPAPRPPASVPLGGSLRASRAAQLTLPDGPLSAVDLADGRALTVERLAAGWVVIADLRDAAPATPERAAAVEAPTRRRRHLGTGLALAAVLGAAVVALATGFSGAPAPAVAGPTPQAVPLQPAGPPQARARGGRAVPLSQPKAEPPPMPPPAPAQPPAVVAPAAAPAPPPPPPAPPLPELPSAPSL